MNKCRYGQGTKNRWRGKRSGSNRIWEKGGLGLSLALLVASCEALPPEWAERLPDVKLPDVKLPEIQLPEIQPRIDSSRPSLPIQSPQTAEIEEQIRQRINEIRQKEGLTVLQANPKLAEVARRYSQQMAEQNFFSHTSPAGDTPAQRVESAGITYLVMGENLFKSTNVPQPVNAAVEGWMNSPGHRENILRSQYRETGIGVWRDGETYYVTQLFLRPIGL
jgi:uncharacterized protein YkwD